SVVAKFGPQAGMLCEAIVRTRGTLEHHIPLNITSRLSVSLASAPALVLPPAHPSGSNAPLGPRPGRITLPLFALAAVRQEAPSQVSTRTARGPAGPALPRNLRFRPGLTSLGVTELGATARAKSLKVGSAPAPLNTAPQAETNAASLPYSSASSRSNSS